MNFLNSVIETWISSNTNDSSLRKVSSSFGSEMSSMILVTRTFQNEFSLSNASLNFATYY